ncbi:MAG TPA: RDD family protein [Sporichthya sp.]|nr:RDD family protein [Sporichthya sp.]
MVGSYECADADELVTAAGLVQRVVARVIDTALCAGGAGLAVLAGADTESWVVAVVAVAVFLAYEAGTLVVWGATPGKLLLGLRVFAFDGGRQLSFGRAAGRVGMYTLVGAVPCGIGQVIMLVTAANDPSGWHRAWHDRAAGTVVVRLPDHGLWRPRR